MIEDPTYDELKAFALWAQNIQPEALEIIKNKGFVFDDLNDPWQKLAFTLYTDLCEVNLKSRQLFEDCDEFSSLPLSWKGFWKHQAIRAMADARIYYRKTLENRCGNWKW